MHPLAQFLTIPFFKILYDGLVGKYTAKISGEGWAYTGSRLYDSNDTPKHIDRKATAKKNTLYTKQYEPEKDIYIYMLIDVGVSMDFGYDGATKKDVQQTVSLLLANVIGDAGHICTILYYDAGLVYTQAELVREQCVFSLQQTFSGPKKNQSASIHSDLSTTLRQIMAQHTHQAHFIILSDDEDVSLLPHLQYLSQQNMISYIHITHSLEDRGIFDTSLSLALEGAYIGALTQDYPAMRQSQLADWKRALQRIGVSYLHINEESDVQRALLSLWR